MQSAFHLLSSDKPYVALFRRLSPTAFQMNRTVMIPKLSKSHQWNDRSIWVISGISVIYPAIWFGSDHPFWNLFILLSSNIICLMFYLVLLVLAPCGRSCPSVHKCVYLFYPVTQKAKTGKAGQVGNFRACFIKPFLLINVRTRIQLIPWSQPRDCKWKVRCG